MLLGEKNYLFREKQNLEMELARLRGRIPAIEEQIVRIKQEIDQKVQGDQVSEELRKILAGQVKYFERVKRLVDDGSVSNSELDDAEEKIARAKIELARRREQIGVSAGTDQLAKFSNELATLTIDMAEKTAMLEIIKNQLDQTEQQLTSSNLSDPQVSRIRMTMQALDIAERRVNELNARLVNLQIPTVSVLGGE
jgi:multidrug resistance efflux pump